MSGEYQPTPGLPGALPAGEKILWQGSPDWRVLARTAFHTRLVAGYFCLLAIVALASGAPVGAVATLGAGVLGLGLLHLLAWGTARATIYTLTSRRIVLRIGIALPKSINLPLIAVTSVDVALRPDGRGDLPLTVKGVQRLGYAGLWPHARPWKLAVPQPMLRAVPDAARVAALVARACLAVQPDARVVPVAVPAAPTPAFGEAVAA